MNLIDLVLAAIVLASLVGGWWRGLLLAGADLVALVGSVLFAIRAYPHGAAWLEAEGLVAGVWAAPVSFLVAFLLARVLLGVVIALLVRSLPPQVHRHRANRLLGVVPGAANGLINATVVAMILLALPADDAITREVAESEGASRLAGPAEWLESRLAPIFTPAVEQTLGKLTVEPGSQQSVKLPFTVADARPRPDLEARMLELVNVERHANGLKPLQADAEAAEVARAHSRDMFARGYFSHVAPDGADPFARMRRAGVAFRAAGENLALARTLAMAHQGLMDSPGHRANILRPAFGRVGIGILDGGRHGLMVTQVFRNPGTGALERAM